MMLAGSQCRHCTQPRYGVSYHNDSEGGFFMYCHGKGEAGGLYSLIDGVKYLQFPAE